ncbi:MAG TPA: hypothetical protein VGM23_12035 [Armatimonadota bacterium]
MREHWNDVPGDIVGENAENLPGGFGVDDPDYDIDATIDELVNNDVTGPDGQGFGPKEEHGGSTTGTSYAAGANTGSSVDPEVLLEDEEDHPGAALGFTGEERDKGGHPEFTPKQENEKN